MSEQGYRHFLKDRVTLPPVRSFTETEEGFDVSTLFEDKPKRHKWADQSFNGSRAAPLWTARCAQCGIQRQKFYSFGERRLVYVLASGLKVENKAPLCEAI